MLRLINDEVIKLGKYEIVGKRNVQLLQSGVTVMAGEKVVVDLETEEMKHAKRHGLIDYTEVVEKSTKENPVDVTPKGTSEKSIGELKKHVDMNAVKANGKV